MRKILAVLLLSLTLVSASFADKYYKSTTKTISGHWSKGASSYLLNNEISKEAYEASKKQALGFKMAIYETTNADGEKFEMFFLFNGKEHEKTHIFFRKFEKEDSGKWK